jgi:hypothetical protein
MGTEGGDGIFLTTKHTKYTKGGGLGLDAGEGGEAAVDDEGGAGDEFGGVG